ncbi:DUF4403 family protein [Hyphobacterium sp. CCMP332]|nr:DUF4403 family protein [Hyphobacterium sp. CCMP332]
MGQNALRIKIAIIFLLYLVSCKPKPDFNRIYGEQPEDQNLSIDTSLIFSEFGVALKDIEARINSDLGKELYKDEKYVKRGAVNMKINVERTGQIKLNGSDNQLFYKVPVKVNGKILINESILGVKIRAEPGFELELVLNLASKIRFFNSFKYGISTEIINIEWPNKPVIQAGPIKVDLSTAIESVLIANEKFLSDIISRTAKSEINLKELVLKTTEEIPKYNFIKTKDIDLWMELEPQSLIIESTPRISNDSIKVKAGLRTLMNINSKRVDSSFIDTKNLKLYAVDDIPDKFNIELKVNIDYLSLDTLIKKQIDRKAVLKSLPEEIQVNNFKTGKWNNENVYLNADVDGKIKGLISTRGQLAYDSLSKSIFLDNMKSNFYSDNFLWSLLYKLYFPGLKSQIQEKINWPLEPLFLKVQNSVMKLFAKLSGDSKLKLELMNLDFEIKDFNLKKNEVEILIRIEGQSNFKFNV